MSKQKMKCQEDYRNQFLAEIKWFAYKALSLLLWLLESPDDISVALLCQLEHPVLIPLLCILIISSSVTESVWKRLQCWYKKVLSSIQNMMECPHSKDLFLITFLLKIVALKMFIWFNFFMFNSCNRNLPDKSMLSAYTATASLLKECVIFKAVCLQFIFLMDSSRQNNSCLRPFVSIWLDKGNFVL